MPPVSEPDRPENTSFRVKFSREKLIETNRRKQLSDGRVASRRTHRREYQHTLHELLGIHGSMRATCPRKVNPIPSMWSLTN